MNLVASPPELTPRLQKYQAALEALPPVHRSEADGILTETREFRGLTLERAIGYLVNLGGTRVGDAEVEGPGWRAELSARKVPVGPSYRLTQVTVTWTGEKAVLEPVILHFRLKAFRAPG